MVLNNAGYAQSAETAFRRYRDTAFFIHDWFFYPLDDPASLARALPLLKPVVSLHAIQDNISDIFLKTKMWYAFFAKM